jgi:5-methylcytosine-specific restriction endonuclease McrA
MPSRRCFKCSTDVPVAQWNAHRQAHADRASRARGYRTTEWKRTAKAVLERNPVCQRCGDKPSEIAHHLHGLRPVDPGGLEPRNLLAVCTSCHLSIHREAQR